MKSIIRCLVLVAVLASSLISAAQIRLPDTRISFEFPQGGWKYLETTTIDDNTTIYLYSYSAKTVTDASGDTILPFLRIYVRKNFNKSIYDLVYLRSLQQPFVSINEYMKGLPSDEGIGYDGAYFSKSDQKDYRFHMIYFKDKDTAFEFRAETTEDTYQDFVEEFNSIINSIKITK